MSPSHPSHLKISLPTVVPHDTHQGSPLSDRVEPGYQPVFNRVELTEIRAPFWGLANNVIEEYYERLG